MRNLAEEAVFEPEQWESPEPFDQPLFVDDPSNDESQSETVDASSTQEQQELDAIPWEEEIADAFGVSETSIVESMPSFEAESVAPVKKRPKLALIVAGVIPVGLFALCWGGISFVQALGSIVDESKAVKQTSASPDDEWQLEAAELRQRLNQKDRRKEIETFNEQVQQQKKKAEETPSSKSRPSDQPPAPNRVVAPKVVYHQAPPIPQPPPLSKPVSSSVRPSSKPKPAPRPPSASRAVSRPAPRPQPRYNSAEPKLSAMEQWDRLASLNTMGSNGAGQNLDFEIDETGVYEYSTPVPEEPSRFPMGLTAEAKLTESLSFRGITSLPASLELISPLGEIPAGSTLSATATVSDGIVTFQVQGYDNLFGYEAISDAQIMASVPAKLKGGGSRSSLLGDILAIGSEVMKEGTGQSINFDGNGRISSVETSTSNKVLDRALGTGADVMSKRLKQSSGRGERYFKLKKGQTITLSVLGE